METIPQLYHRSDRRYDVGQSQGQAISVWSTAEHTYWPLASILHKYAAGRFVEKEAEHPFALDA
jgi:hypothetical protein